MLDINDWLANILTRQLSIVIFEQSQNVINLERIDNALIGANNAVILIASLNETGITTITQESMNTLMSKLQLDNLINTQAT